MGAPVTATAAIGGFVVKPAANGCNVGHWTYRHMSIILRVSPLKA
jgi:hypothetical protein